MDCDWNGTLSLRGGEPASCGSDGRSFPQCRWVAAVALWENPVGVTRQRRRPLGVRLVTRCTLQMLALDLDLFDPAGGLRDRQAVLGAWRCSSMASRISRSPPPASASSPRSQPGLARTPPGSFQRPRPLLRPASCSLLTAPSPPAGQCSPGFQVEPCRWVYLTE